MEEEEIKVLEEEKGRKLKEVEEERNGEREGKEDWEKKRDEGRKGQ
jgi:hypothetical protein